MAATMFGAALAVGRPALEILLGIKSGASIDRPNALSILFDSTKSALSKDLVKIA